MTPSMTCEQLESILPDLLDDDAAMTPLARAHLEQCAGCGGLFDDLRAIRSAAGALPALTPSRDLWSGIASRIQTPIVPLVEGTPVARAEGSSKKEAAQAAAKAALGLLSQSR
jgi:hypothetical protein